MPTIVHVLAAFLFLFALNGRLRARKILFWQLGLLALEFGVFVAPAGVLLLVFALREGWAGTGAAVLAIASVALLLWPEYASWRLGRGLEKRVLAHIAPGSSAKTPGAVRPATSDVVCETFSYVAPGGVSRPVVFYRPGTPTPAPCVVVAHSGGWESGSPEEFPGFHRALAEAGYAVASVGYSLAPAARWPAPREDMRAAVAWLRENAATLGVDPDRLVLFGRSAGGQIALCTAYDTPPPGVRGVISFYAPTDMVFAWTGSYDGDILDSPKLLRNYLGGRPRETPEIHADASPTRLAEAGPVLPTLLLHGRRDELVWCIQLRKLARLLRRSGTPHFSLILPWARHAFDYRTRGPGGRLALRATLTFLDSVVK